MDPPEVAILTLCLSHGDRAEKLKLLANISQAEWRAVASLTYQLDVAPLLHHTLEQMGIALPGDVAAELKRAFLGNTRHNLLIYRELGSFLPRLNEQNIPVIVLKGAYLAQAVYDDIGLRPMGDIDLLISLPDVEKAIGLLEASGYKADRPFWPEVDGVVHHHAPPMLKDGLSVELHWSLTHDSNLTEIDLQRLWARAQRFGLQGTETLALSQADLVVHLAVHASYSHYFCAQYRSLYDLEAVLRKFGADLDWAEIIRTCQAWQAERGTYLALRLAGELFGTQVPQKVLEKLQPSDWTEKALGWAKVLLFQANPVQRKNYNPFMHSLRLGEKIAAFFRGLFPSRAVMAILYGVPPGSRRILTLYPHHIVTRLWRYLGHAWSLIPGNLKKTADSKSEQSLREWLKIS